MLADDDNKKDKSSAALPALVPIPLLAWWWSVQHQAAQEAIAASTAAGLALLWVLMSRDDLDKSTPGWLHAVTLQIERGWRESAAEGFEFFKRALLAAEPDADVPKAPAKVEFPAREIQTAMRVTGPVRVKKQIAMARPVDEAMESGKDLSEGTGMTKTVDGGRQQVAAEIERVTPERVRKRKAIGWARVTDDNPCYFCALLASQGAVFKSADAFKHSDAKYTGPGTVKVHDRCACTIRPVFSKDDFRDARAKFFLDQWIKNGRATAGSSAENNFRKKYVPPPPYSASGLTPVERSKVITDAQRNLDALLARGFSADSPNVKFYEESINRLMAGV